MVVARCGTRFWPGGAEAAGGGEGDGPLKGGGEGGGAVKGADGGGLC